MYWNIFILTQFSFRISLYGIWSHYLWYSEWYFCFTKLVSTITFVHTSDLMLLGYWTRNCESSSCLCLYITQNSRREWDRHIRDNWHNNIAGSGRACVHVLSDSSPPSCAESWQLKIQKHTITHLSERLGLTTHQQLYHVTDSPNSSHDFFVCLSLDSSNYTRWRVLEPQILIMLLLTARPYELNDEHWQTDISIMLWDVSHLVCWCWVSPWILAELSMLCILLLNFHWGSPVGL